MLSLIYYALIGGAVLALWLKSSFAAVALAVAGL
jgi:hypothetical protein